MLGILAHCDDDSPLLEQRPRSPPSEKPSPLPGAVPDLEPRLNESLPRKGGTRAQEIATKRERFWWTTGASSSQAVYGPRRDAAGGRNRRTGGSGVAPSCSETGFEMGQRCLARTLVPGLQSFPGGVFRPEQVPYRVWGVRRDTCGLSGRAVVRGRAFGETPCHPL